MLPVIAKDLAKANVIHKKNSVGTGKQQEPEDYPVKAKQKGEIQKAAEEQCQKQQSNITAQLFNQPPKGRLQFLISIAFYKRIPAKKENVIEHRSLIRHQ
ncbi:MAG: hypothetical protein MJ075_03985 [Oscillospiraceae bacterium]|nr:hypothetical protein [Oscillospiraceae bacterium]